MDIKPQYLQPYLYDIAINQLTDDYKAKGYQVSKEEKIGEARADLVARKGEEVIIIEVNAGKLTADKRQQIAGIGDYVRTHKNHRFLVVLATPPKPKKIAIPNLAQVLVNYLNLNYTAYLNKKASAYDTQYLSVTDLVLNELTLTEMGDVKVVGNALVQVEFKYATNIEGVADANDTAYEDVLPCVFDVVLTHTSDSQLFISAVNSLDIDTSD